MSLAPHWEALLSHMVSTPRRITDFGDTPARVPEFESYIIQSAEHATSYAESVIRGPWPEAEDIILSDIQSSFKYAKSVIRGRWEKCESLIATDPSLAYEYAKFVLKGRFPLGEAAIATDSTQAYRYATQILKSRFIEGEAVIASTETVNRNTFTVKEYKEIFVGIPKSSGYVGWAGWTEEQLMRSPCWMYLYAKECMDGRLPDTLHNSMIVFGMTIPENYYVKRYMKAKKYHKRIKRRKAIELPEVLQIKDDPVDQPIDREEAV